MAASSGRQLITGVPRTPNPYGLFTVVTPREPADPHWQWGGVEWEAPPCRNLGTIGQPDCDPGTNTPGLPKSFNKAGPVLNEADPFTVYGVYKCAPVGQTLSEAQDIATQQLLAQEQSDVEWEVWSGHTGAATNLPGSAEPVADAPQDPVVGLAMLEAYFHGHTGTVNGLLGYIHMGVSAATILQSRNVLIRSGNQIATAVGSRVIIGTGYGSTVDNGDGTITDRIYITPPPFVLRSDIFTSSDRPGDLLDRRNNDLYAIAERTYLVGWDDCPISYYVDITWAPEDDSGGLPTPNPFTIDTPADGASFDPNTDITVTGQGTPGRTVILSNGQGTIFDQELTVDEDGTWTATETFGTSLGGQNVTLTATQGLRSAAVTIAINDTSRTLRITSPVAGAWNADDPIEVVGTGGDPDWPITCKALDDQDPLAEQTGIVPDADGNWTTTLDATPWDSRTGYVTLSAEDEDPDVNQSNSVSLEVT